MSESTSLFSHIHPIPSLQEVGIGPQNNMICIADLWEFTSGFTVVDIPISKFSATDIQWTEKLCENDEQLERVVNADLNYPIIVSNTKYPYFIWDGNHRLAKAILLEHKSIKGVAFTEAMEQLILRK